MADRDPLAEAIWHASRADEGTISWHGANHVADAVRAFLASDETVERAARGVAARNSRAWADPEWDELTQASRDEHAADARAALAAATEMRS